MIPPVSQDYADRVRALPERRRDVICDVEHPLVVVGEAGVEHVVADLLPVDVKLVVPQAADVGGGHDGLAFKRDLLSEQDRSMLQCRLFGSRRDLARANPPAMAWATSISAAPRRKSPTRAFPAS